MANISVLMSIYPKALTAGPSTGSRPLLEDGASHQRPSYFSFEIVQPPWPAAQTTEVQYNSCLEDTAIPRDQVL